MAGSFGFETDHYAVSQAIGERHLLPAVRAAAPDTMIVADGFSCREQIAQATGRRAMHLADVIALATRAGREPLSDYPERQQLVDHTRSRVSLPTAALWMVGAAGLAIAVMRRGR